VPFLFCLILHDFSKRSGFVYLIIILGVTQKGSGYSLQVLALPSSGCGLFAAIPHAGILGYIVAVDTLGL
jgi:hypothetical protein